MKFIRNTLLVCSLLSCHANNEKSDKTPEIKAAKPEKTISKPTRQQLMEFVEYNDDGDYFLVIAQKGDSIF